MMAATKNYGAPGHEGVNKTWDTVQKQVCVNCDKW